SLSLASRSIVDNGNLVTKVYFPREILPLASIGAASVDFGLQAVVLIGFMAAFLYPFVGMNLLLLPLSLIALYSFTVALALWVAGVLACVALGSLLLAALAWRTFFRLSGDFAEEL